MKMMRTKVGLPVVGILLALLFALPGWGQYIGSVSPQTVQKTLAPAGTACTGADQIFAVQNLGQGNHYASATANAAVTSFQMEIDGVDSAGNIYRISDQLRGKQGYLGGSVAGSGYFPIVRVRVNCLPVTTGTFTLTYNGGSAISPINSGSFLFSQVDKPIALGAPQATALTDVFQTPFGNSSGRLTFEWISASAAGASASVSCAGAFALGGIWTWTFPIVSTLAPQTFPLPDVPCTSVSVAYAGVAGASTYNLEYIFNAPGFHTSSYAVALSSALNLSPMLVEKGSRWDVVNAPSVSTQASASQTAGAATGVRHVADCVSYSAGAITAPTATQLTINLRDGATGAGTVIWSKTVVIPATAVNHLDGNFCGLNLLGSVATAMTLEFSAALTNEFESVTLTGYDVE
jgi:hypothetical protein